MPSDLLVKRKRASPSVSSFLGSLRAFSHPPLARRLAFIVFDEQKKMGRGGEAGSSAGVGAAEVRLGATSAVPQFKRNHRLTVPNASPTGSFVRSF